MQTFFKIFPILSSGDRLYTLRQWWYDLCDHYMLLIPIHLDLLVCVSIAYVQNIGFHQYFSCHQGWRKWLLTAALQIIWQTSEGILLELLWILSFIFGSHFTIGSLLRLMISSTNLFWLSSIRPRLDMLPVSISSMYGMTIGSQNQYWTKSTPVGGHWTQTR